MTEEQANQNHAMRARFVQSVIIIVAAGMIALVTYYASRHSMIPQEYVDPIYAVIILIGGYLLTRIIAAAIDRVVDPRLGRTRSRGAKNLFQIIAAILIVVTILGIFGLTSSTISNWLIGAGFLGIILGLAAQQVLGNLFAGISLLGSRPFEIGDRITLVPNAYGLIGMSYPHENIVNGYTGIIYDIGLFYTTMNLDDGVPLVLPNSVVIAALALNHNKVKRRTVRVRMDVDKKIPFDQFKNQFTSILTQNTNELFERETLRMDIIDSSIQTYQVMITAWSKSTSEEPVKSELIQCGLQAQKKLAG